jgi:hypothetical protein
MNRARIAALAALCLSTLSFGQDAAPEPRFRSADDRNGEALR